MVRGAKQEVTGRWSRKQKKKTPMKTLKCDNCGDMALVGDIYHYETMTDPEFISKPGASINFECLACGMHTYIRTLTSNEMTMMAIRAKKDGHEYCPHCSFRLGKKNIDKGHTFGNCPRCGGEV